MEITEIRIKLMDEPGERLRAFCSITLDDMFVIRDLKIIEGTTGPFVAMPSRKLTARCPECSCKNHVRAMYCNQCGSKLRPLQSVRDDDGRPKLYADIAHPINSTCREMIQERLVLAFEEEVARSRQPGYTPTYFDYDNEEQEVELRESRNAAPNARYAEVHGPHKLRPPHRMLEPKAEQPKRDGFGAGILERAD